MERAAGQAPPSSEGTDAGQLSLSLPIWLAGPGEPVPAPPHGRGA
jgi:hypothetical protein